MNLQFLTKLYKVDSKMPAIVMPRDRAEIILPANFFSVISEIIEIPNLIEDMFPNPIINKPMQARLIFGLIIKSKLPPEHNDRNKIERLMETHQFSLEELQAAIGSLM